MSELLSWTADKDSAIIPRLLALHASCAAPVILDATSNDGVMWQGSGYAPAVRVDVSRDQAPDVWADCRALPFAAGTFDVITFDPPHIPGGGSRHTLPGYSARYGLGTLDSTSPAAIPALFAPFLAEAVRVVRRGGLVLAKMSNPVYWDRRQWYSHLFWQAVGGQPGLRYEDECVKVRTTPMPQDSRPAVHLRSAHSTWAVVRRVGR